MRNPKTVFTEHGYADWMNNLHQLDSILFTIYNNADDLHIPEEIVAAVHTLRDNADLLRTGVEGYEDDE